MVQSFAWNGGGITAAVRRGAVAGLEAAAEAVLADSQKRVPTETSELAESASVEVDDRGLVAAISYNTPYAVRQHENLRLRHHNGETSKYLWRAMKVKRAEAERLIAEGIRGALK